MSGLGSNHNNMYCAKLTLIDRRHSSTAVAVRASKSKHATSTTTTGFKRNCLIKELNAARTNITDRNRYAGHEGEDGDEEDLHSNESFTSTEDPPTDQIITTRFAVLLLCLLGLYYILALKLLFLIRPNLRI